MTRPDRFEISVLSDPGAIAALELEWDLLADHAGIPFLRLDWLTSWWVSFRAQPLRIYVARVNGELRGVLPLVGNRSTLRSPTNAHTPTFLPLGDASAVSALADSAFGSGVGSLVLGRVPTNDPLVTTLADSSRRAGRLTWQEPGQVGSVVDTTGDLDRYLRDRDRHTRRELGRLRRKLETEHQGVELRPFAEPIDLEGELQEALELEAGGWKGRRGTAILCHADTAAFYRAVATNLARRGEFRLSTLVADGRLIAFDMCVLAHGRAWMLKGAYDESYSPYAPGLVLLLAEIKRAFELGLDAVDLLGGSDPYKLKFATDLRPHAALHSHRRLPIPVARLSYRRAARPTLRRVYRKLRPR